MKLAEMKKAVATLGAEATAIENNAVKAAELVADLREQVRVAEQADISMLSLDDLEMHQTEQARLEKRLALAGLAADRVQEASMSRRNDIARIKREIDTLLGDHFRAQWAVHGPDLEADMLDSMREWFAARILAGVGGARPDLSLIPWKYDIERINVQALVALRRSELYG